MVSQETVDRRTDELRAYLAEARDKYLANDARIAAVLGIDRSIVQRYFDSLRPSRSDGGTKRNSSETCHLEEASPVDEVIE